MNANKPRLVALNHIALEVGDVEEALRFSRKRVRLRAAGHPQGRRGPHGHGLHRPGRPVPGAHRRRTQGPDTQRHFGLVVDDRSAVMASAQAAGAATDRNFNVIDPWGNHVEIVAYADVQFSKTEAVLRSMGLSLDKSAKAKEELRRKGITEPGVEG